MALKDDLLKQLDEGYPAFKRTFAGLSDQQMSRVWLGTWSVKDLLAHVAGWHWEMGRGLERIAQGQRPTPEGVDYSNGDSWNAKFAADKKSQTASQVVADLDASFAAYRKAAAGIPENRYEPGRTVDRMIHTNAIDHYKEHGKQIEDWRKTLR
ncbi:MAG: ClbS/DfsB family four-helix bundle protein [SAR202 cluster bacterium]|nr:ClbS/DfsB family four-helix bundle protein [SAR202 cluster bacterium]